MDTGSTIGLLHPGQMGSAVGAAASTGHQVLWASEGRSEITAARASADGLEDVVSLARLVEAEVILSVCPPQVAGEVARAVAATGFDGLYVDANAVSPDAARSIGATVEAAGASFVDGGIIGFPPRTAGSTRLYLSGERADEVAGIFTDSPLEARVVDGPPGTASALKMAYAAWTKGSSALILAVRALARAEKVEEDLLGEWALSQPDAEGRTDFAATVTAPHAWRFAPEPRALPAPSAAAGVPDGFWRAAAEVYEQISGFRDRPVGEVDADEVLDRLAGRAGP